MMRILIALMFGLPIAGCVVTPHPSFGSVAGVAALSNEERDQIVSAVYVEGYVLYSVTKESEERVSVTVVRPSASWPKEGLVLSFTKAKGTWIEDASRREETHLMRPTG
jgi:hypothetical protein